MLYGTAHIAGAVTAGEASADSSVVAEALPKRDIAVAGKWALTRRIMA
jgi:hypothetical protein